MNANATDNSHLLQLILDECRRNGASSDEIFAMIDAAAPCHHPALSRFHNEVRRFGTRWASRRYGLVWK